MGDRPRRTVHRVDYAALEAGLRIDMDEDVQTTQQDGLPVPNVSNEDMTDAATLRQAIAAAQAEQERLNSQHEVAVLKQQLDNLRAANEQLRLKMAAPEAGVPPPSTRATADMVRSDPQVLRAVERQLHDLGLNDSSSDEDGADYQCRSRNRGKKLRSGKTAKLTSRVKYPQLWPHSELSLSYVSKDITYDKLSLPEFAAGYSSILRLPQLEVTERNARIEHLASLMYFATQFPWPLVRSLHAAVLFEIECGRLCWGDSFSHLESRVLFHQQRNDNVGSTRQVHFCRAYQSGKCSSQNDHWGMVKNERKWVQHICAKCWLSTQESKRHSESSTDCPLNVKSSSPQKNNPTPQ